jgi:DNA-binding transcriptional ArsR family regulator
MSSAFPHQTPVDHTPKDADNVVVRRNDSTDVFEVLSSDTAQAIVATLRNEPHTTSEIAESIGTSIQNVQYHLERLEGADLVETAGTWYSARGKPMTVFALASERIVVTFEEA